MKTLLEQQFVQRADHVVWKVAGEKGLLLNLENGAYFEINPVGLAIWKRCDGRTPLSKLASAIQQEFGGDSARVTQDLSQFVGELKRQKILQLSENTSSRSVPAR